jgi:hypothetical protein
MDEDFFGRFLEMKVKLLILSGSIGITELEQF